MSHIKISHLSLIDVIAAAILAVGLALLLAAAAGAATPDGSSPQAAIPLTGTVTGSLGPGQAAWYTYWHDANFNDAVTLKANPPVQMTPTTSGDYWGGAYFNVEWAGASTDASFPGGQFAKDLPGYYRVAQSTQANLDDGSGPLPAGTQFWQLGKSTFSTSFTIEVLNQSSSPISYALTLARSNDAVSASDNALPAPSAPLTVAAPASNVGSVASAPVAAVAISAAPTTGGGSVPVAAPPGLSASHGVYVGPTVTVGTDPQLGTRTYTIQAIVASTGGQQVQVHRLDVILPSGAIVSATTPSQAVSEDGIVWYLDTLVDADDPLLGYSVTTSEPPTGAIVKADWATSTDNGTVSATVKVP